MPGKLSLDKENTRSISDPLLDASHLEKKLSCYQSAEQYENMSEGEYNGNRFKTWPERHDKMNQSDEQYSKEKCQENCKAEELPPGSLNLILDSIPLAYSPVTKQLHFFNPSDHRPGDTTNPDAKGDELQNFTLPDPNFQHDDKSEEKCKSPKAMLELSQNLGKDLVLRKCLKRLEINPEEKLGYVWNSKIGCSGTDRACQPEAVKGDASVLQTEASSFSSILSSLSEDSPSNLDDSLSGKLPYLDSDDLSVRSHYSHDSSSNCGESSKFFDEKTPGPEKSDVKRRGFSGFFTRNMFSWKGPASAQGWKLFGRIAADECKDTLNACNNLESTGGELSRADSPLGTKKYEDVVASSSALILHNRPANLPAKSVDEEQKHRLEYQQIVEAAKRKELKETKRRKKQLQKQLKIEEQLAAASRIWSNEILPKWDLMKNSKKARDLWWMGIPPCVRGKVWKLAIGNELNVTNQLYEICLSRAQDRLKEPEAHLSGNVANKESSVELIQLDISRTFPHLCIFQKGGPYYDILHCLLGAYVCYRPDLGYVQGMSFIAAILILNMEAADAFVSFSNLLNRPCHMAFFSLNQTLMQAYYDTYNEFFRENLPRLSQHFEDACLTTDLYLLDWVYSVFAKAMPLDIACRVWDVYLRDGEEFLFRTALGILHLHEDKLMKLDFIYAAQFLTKLPEDLSADSLFKSIEAIKMNIGKQKFNQVLTGYIKKNSR